MASLQDLQDRLDLQDLVNRYAQVNDYSDDADELLRLMTDDAVLVGHFPGRDASGADALRRYAEAIIEMKATTKYRHHVSNVLTTIDGDNAQIRAFFILVYRTGLYDEQVQLSQTLYGNFEFEARRVNGEWLISRRVVHLDPS